SCRSPADRVRMALMYLARRSRNPLAGALWANALALGLIAAALLLRGGDADRAEPLPGLLPAAYAQGMPPIAGGGGFCRIPAQLASNILGVYVMESASIPRTGELEPYRKGTICVSEIKATRAPAFDLGRLHGMARAPVDRVR